MKVLLLSFLLIIITACADETPTTGDHVWKEQTDTISQAEQVEGLLQDAAKQQAEAIQAIDDQ